MLFRLLVQAGPGIPAWRDLTYAYEWSGPVDPEQSVRFIFIGPVLLGVWRLVGVMRRDEADLGRIGLMMAGALDEAPGEQLRYGVRAR